MGFRHHFFGAELRKALSNGAEQISRGPARLFTPKLAEWRVWIFFLLAGVLGISAYRVTREEARVEWLLTHPVSFSIWEEALEKRGYLRVMEPEALESIWSSMPYLSSSRAPRVWITENSRVVTLLALEEKRSYTWGSGTPERIATTQWEPLGIGWEAWDAFLIRSIPRPTPSRLPKPRPHRDAREIIY